MSRYIPLPEVCAKLSCSRQTFDLRFRFAAGFPPELFNRRWSEAAIDEWMEASRVSRPIRKARSSSKSEVSSDPGGRSSRPIRAA